MVYLVWFLTLTLTFDLDLDLWPLTWTIFFKKIVSLNLKKIKICIFCPTAVLAALPRDPLLFQGKSLECLLIAFFFPNRVKMSHFGLKNYCFDKIFWVQAMIKFDDFSKKSNFVILRSEIAKSMKITFIYNLRQSKATKSIVCIVNWGIVCLPTLSQCKNVISGRWLQLRHVRFIFFYFTGHMSFFKWPALLPKQHLNFHL